MDLLKNAKVQTSGSSTLFETLYSMTVVDFFFLRVAQNFICKADFFELNNKQKVTFSQDF